MRGQPDLVLALACLMAWFFLSAAKGAALYDGSLNTLPAQQGWIFLAQPLLGNAVRQTAGQGITILDTTAETADKAGYFSNVPPLKSHPANPVLDHAAGFVVRFGVRVNSETHNKDDRAGFSVIVIASDLQGVELAFWTDEIWVHEDNPLFAHGEGRNVDTTAALAVYELALQGESYALSANGELLLTGRLRNYSSFGQPYDIANFLFFGDDASSAAASVELASITVDPIHPLTPPKLSVAVWDSRGLELALIGEPGWCHTVEVSTDLLAWTTFTNVTPARPTVSILDPAATNLTRRFYRAVVR